MHGRLDEGEVRPLIAQRFGDGAVGRLVIVEREKLAGVEEGSRDWNFYTGKIASAKFFCRNMLTNVFSRWESLQLEDSSAIDIPDEAF